MRSLFKLAAVAALFLFASIGRAEEPAKYYLVDGKVAVESRVADLEKKVADLEAQVAALKGGTAKAGAINAVAKSGCTYCDNCQCAPGVCPACPTARADAPGVLTTTDGRKIAWAGTTYVFVDQPPAAVAWPAQTCTNGSCQIRQR